MHIMKPEGGNWIPGEVENAVKHLKRGAHEVNPRDAQELGIQLSPEDAALNSWVDKNLTNYLKKQMGTEKDPVRLLADEGITHYSSEGAMRNALNTSYQQFVENRKLRGKLGMPEQPKATTDLGRTWEEGVDSLLDQGNMVSPKQLKGGNIWKENPWLQKLPPDSTLYRLDRPSVDDMNLPHIIDVLREDLATRRISPSDLKNFSMDRAIRRTHEYNQEMAKNAEAAKAKKIEGMPVYKEYPNGFKWVKLEKPGDFAAESNAMGHSVRGYEPPPGHPDWVKGSEDRGNPSYGLGGWEAIKSGKAQVYSLVDSKGNPHATIEAGTVRNPRYEEISNHFDEAHKEVIKEMNARGMDTSDPTKANGLAWKRAEEIAKEQNYQFVNQIKGKGNARPVDKYDPYTQDFVTSGDWKDVRDLQNTGLKRLDEAFTRKSDRDAFEQLYPDQKYVTSDEIKTCKTKTDQDLIEQYKDWKSKVDLEDPKFKDYEGPEFISNEEYFKHYYPDDPAVHADFIRGGMDSPNMIPPERLGMKDWDTLMNEGVFSYDDVSFLTKVMPQRYLTAEDIAKAKARLEEPPLAEKSGGLIHMTEGGTPRLPTNLHPDVEEALKAGRITPNQAKWMSNLAKTAGNPEIGTAGIVDGISEKMMNYRNAVRAGEYTRPSWMEPIPKEVKMPKWFDGKLDLDREGLRQLDKIPALTRKAFNASEYSNTFPVGTNDLTYFLELMKASQETPDYQPYIDEINKIKERNPSIGKAKGGEIRAYATGGADEYNPEEIDIIAASLYEELCG